MCGVFDIGAVYRFDKHRLQVRLPPEPSDVIWENIESRQGSRCLRSTFTLACTLLFLGLRSGRDDATVMLTISYNDDDDGGDYGYDCDDGFDATVR